MNKKLIVPLLLGALVLLALYLTGQIGHKEDGAPPLYGNVDIREATLSFRVAGRVASVLVDEGAHIKAGELLATLDQEPLLNTLHSAEANVAALQARNTLLHQGYRQEEQQQARSQVTAAQAALTEAERQLARLKALKPSGATTQNALDSALSRRDQAKTQLHEAQAGWQNIRPGFRAQELEESDANLAQAHAALASAQLAVNDAQLRAPSNGILLTRAIEPGEMVQVGSSAFTLSLTEPVWVRAYVAEPQLGQYPTGQKVTLWSDSRPQQPYHGVVGFVSPQAEFTPKPVETSDLRTSLVYRIRVVVEDADAQLRQGMPMTVRVAP